MMQNDEGFREVLNSIQSLNVASKVSDDEQPCTSNVRYSDSGFCSTGGSDMNPDNIFFYEDSCPSLSSCFDNGNEFNFNRDIKSEMSDHRLPSPGKSHKDQELTQIKVNVGIDEDLKMILEMDPSLMDESIDKALEPSSNVVDTPKVLGLPPKVPPTFKTSTTTSRTQLKLQLQREQLLQEAELKSLQNQQQKKHQNSDTEPKVEMQSIGLDVPPQILQVRTKLANPTKYHVIQKQQNQVKEYLSESFKSTDSLNNLIPASVIQHNASKSQPVTTCSSPITKSSTNQRLLNHIASRNGFMSQSASNENSMLFQDFSAASSGPNLSLLLQQKFNFNSSVESAMSPPLSSVATSVTSASEAEDYIDELLNGDSFSDSIKCENIKIKEEPQNQSEVDIKDRIKKDNHNMIERRRRFNINDRIKELGTLLPKSNESYYEIVRDIRPNKGTILKSSVDYIKCLKQEINRLQKVETKQREMEQNQKEMEQVIKKLMTRINELEDRDRRIEMVNQPHPPQMTTSTTDSNWMNYATHSPSTLTHQNNSFSNDYHQKQMPDVVNDVHSMNLNVVEEFMDEEHHRDPLLSHLNAAAAAADSHQPANLLNLDHHHLSTVDMSAIDPIISNFNLIEAMQQANDADSLINDIDMMT